MPKSRNKRNNKKSRKPAARKSKRMADAAPPPFRSIEPLLASMQNDDQEPDSPSRRAQEIIYDAWERPYAQDRIKLAREALALWPGCADALVILAEESAQSIEETVELYRDAVAAGERALREETFSEDVGHFWGLLETRPYMRARAGLARILAATGQPDEAVEHYRDMLRLSPGDNQGNRYSLMHLLMEQGQDKEAANLLDEYPDDCMAEWAYGRDLLAFRRYGASEKADALLIAALKRNSSVPAYLLGRRRIPKPLPVTIGLGDNNEAIAYAADYKAIWKQTPGSLDWLKSNLGTKAP